MNNPREDIIDLDAPAAKALAQETREAGDYAATYDEKGSALLPLEHPVTLTYRKNNQDTTETLTSLTIRRPNGGDLRHIMNFKNEGDQVTQMFMRLSGHPALVFDKLDIADIGRVTEVIGNFTPESLKGGVPSLAR